MTETIAGVDIPDTELAREATELVRKNSTPLLFDHSRRVFLFATLKGRYRGIEADPELLYVGAMFHDLGLTESYRRTDQRFEIDGADLARGFLLDHRRSAAKARAVWLGIALHTTPGVPNHLEPETALVSLGVEVDVLGFDLDQITAEQGRGRRRGAPATGLQEQDPAGLLRRDEGPPRHHLRNDERRRTRSLHARLHACGLR